MSSRILYVQHPVSLRIFPSVPGSRLRFFIAREIQDSTAVHAVFDALQPKLMHPVDKKLTTIKNVDLFCIQVAQHHFLQSMKVFLHIPGTYYENVQQ